MSKVVHFPRAKGKTVVYFRMWYCINLQWKNGNEMEIMESFVSTVHPNGSRLNKSDNMTYSKKNSRHTKQNLSVYLSVVHVHTQRRVLHHQEPKRLTATFLNVDNNLKPSRQNEKADNPHSYKMYNALKAAGFIGHVQATNNSLLTQNRHHWSLNRSSTRRKTKNTFFLKTPRHGFTPLPSVPSQACDGLRPLKRSTRDFWEKRRILPLSVRMIQTALACVSQDER